MTSMRPSRDFSRARDPFFLHTSCEVRLVDRRLNAPTMETDRKSLTPRSQRALHDAPDLRRLNRVTAWLFVLAYLLTLVEPADSGLERLTIALLSSTSLALGIFGFAWVQRRGIWAGMGYLFIQLTLSTFLVMLAGVGIGNTLMVLLALAQGSRVLPLWLALLFCSHLLVAHLGMARWQDVAREGVGLFVAGVGVVLITRVAVNERELRGQKEALADELGAANRQLQSYALQAEELAATRERNRLAREIHDGLGHHLTAAHMQLQAAQAVMPEHPERAEAALEKARTLTQEALTDVRRSVHALRVTTRPLAQALEALVQDVGVPTELTVCGSPRTLPEGLEDNLYRIAQEGLTNIRKHAGATCATVTLMYETHAVELIVRDDGRGSTSMTGGFGLTGVRERVEAFGGELDLQTAPGHGLTLHVRVPA